MEKWQETLKQVWDFVYEVPLFHLQEHKVTLSHIVIAIVVMILAVILSKVVRIILQKRMFPRFKLDPGLSFALLRVIHYCILIGGVYVALTSMNVPLAGLTALVAFLGVGIGFGFQNLVNNFVSGIMLLFERPVKIGDRITVDDIWGDVVQINLRTTVVNSVDNISIIIPNSKLLENNLINWSYGDPKIRIKLPVGVAYGSDIDLVTDCLQQAAKACEEILEKPEPQVLFTAFGDSSLNFELYTWIRDSRHKPQVLDQLHRQIDRVFRDHDVEIPFPQRDLHVRRGDAPLDVVTKAG